MRFELGGSIREQYEAYRNFELAVDPEREGWDGYHLHRLMLHADLTVDDRWRAFGEFGNSIISGNERPASPVDEDAAYLHQGFGEVALRGGLASDEGLSLRVGRQELSFGSGRLVSLRDGPNIRQSFDAARVSYRGAETEWDVFGGAEVQTRPENFDNRVDGDELFWGGYVNLYGAERDRGVDLYYLGIDREDATFDVGTATETRHSIGARIWGQADCLDYNFEPVVQFGRFGDREILAWTIASDTGLQLGDDPEAPHIGLRANVISGGSSDDRLSTFNGLFPNNSYFSEAALFAPANLIDVNPTVTVEPHEDVSLRLMWDHLWRFDLQDGIYSPPGVPLIGSAQSQGRYIGHALSLLTEWEVVERTKLFAAFTHFEAGRAVESGGGDDVDYFLLGFDVSF